jgi:adenosylhomocysteinase
MMGSVGTLVNPQTAFFEAILRSFPHTGGIACLIVTHILPDRPALLGAIGRAVESSIVLAKPRSIHRPTMQRLATRFPIEVQGQRFRDAAGAYDILLRHCAPRPTIILDMGGYFAQVADELARRYEPGLLGIVEDTENGLQRYLRAAVGNCPVISVARSPLKNPEDFLVGQSIVFSVEALLRARADILHGRTACVIGYGKLGRSIANLLHARHVRTVVFDQDPIKSIEAMSHGFPVTSAVDQALRGAGLVFCATGNLALRQEHFALLENDAYVATVTSSDDELAVDDLRRSHEIRRVSRNITACSAGGRRFYLMNHGQAVNFIHGAAVGPFIYLIQAELIASLAALSRREIPPGITENENTLRAKLRKSGSATSECRERPMIEMDLERTLDAYTLRFPQDAEVVDQLRALILQKAEVTSRKEHRGHVTCSAILMDSDRRLLMIRHKALARWLFPGGHIESADLSLREAARRELVEETGMPALGLADPANDFGTLPIQLDRHMIPANPDKAEPEHPHFDFRFVFNGGSTTLDLDLSEVTDCDWVAANAAPLPIRSRLRELSLV